MLVCKSKQGVILAFTFTINERQITLKVPFIVIVLCYDSIVEKMKPI